MEQRLEYHSNIPRLLIAGTGSGSGKTTVVCALLGALLQKEGQVQAFKCGPDYIDPMFHTRCVGVSSRSLDLFLLGEETVRGLYCKNSTTGISIIEGAMGFYDGMGTTTQGSAYELAKVLQVPVILVVDCKGMSLSAGAQVLGYRAFRPDNGIAGVFLNGVSHSFYPRLRQAVEEETGLPVVGYLPRMPDCEIGSRHLGLRDPKEITNIAQVLDTLAKEALGTVDFALLGRLAALAPPISGVLCPPQPLSVQEGVRIGIALDEAFSFYYQDALDLLQETGARLIPFSPLHDRQLPPGLDGLLLGGGYPEEYARELWGNKSMRESLTKALEGGLPCVAECGGFLYLQEWLEGTDGQRYPMLGALAGGSLNTGRLQRFGYCTLTAEEDNLLCYRGEQINAHEFHYWDSEQTGELFAAQKPGLQRKWKAGVQKGNILAGYPHLHWWAKPCLAARFLQLCLDGREKDGTIETPALPR